jgi:hypothetical protein
MMALSMSWERGISNHLRLPSFMPALAVLASPPGAGGLDAGQLLQLALQRIQRVQGGVVGAGLCGVLTITMYTSLLAA